MTGCRSQLPRLRYSRLSLVAAIRILHVDRYQLRYGLQGRQPVYIQATYKLCVEVTRMCIQHGDQSGFRATLTQLVIALVITLT